MIGQTYNRLTVIEEVYKTTGRNRRFKCLCVCGTYTEVSLDKIRSGSTKSCGCWMTEVNKKKAYKLYGGAVKYTPYEATARRVAQSRSYKDIPFEHFMELSQKDCYYCGEPPFNKQNCAGKNSSQNMRDNADFIYNGLDRIDNNLGHVVGNLVPCCKFCNWSKRDRAQKEFYEWALSVNSHIDSSEELLKIIERGEK